MTESRLQSGTLDYEGIDYIPPYVQNGYWDRMEMVRQLVIQVREPLMAVVDLGCNAGHFLGLVGPPCWGYDIAKAALSVGIEEGFDVRRADILRDELELAPIVTICEVLEHLDDPHAVVSRLNQDPVEYVIASGPYKETPEDYYEQHCWAWDQEGFARMFTDIGFTVNEQRTVGIFQALVAVR